jgi:iron complex outermembrane recepter protein
VSKFHRAGLVARLSLIAGTGAFVASGAAIAQTQDSIAEIVVTARKIEENLKEVPLAITAFSSEQIQSAGINNLNDLANLTPGLQFFNPIGEFLPTPVIRGVAPTDIFGENNVGIFLDGIYVAGREGLNFSQLDVERIEVVKGPQSALYGRSAFTGAINYITKKPTEEFEATADGTFGNDGYLVGKVSVSGPLIGETFRGRIAALYDEFDGSYSNPVPGGNPDVGGHKYRTLLGSLLYEPGEVFDGTFTAYYSDDEIDDAALTTAQSNCQDSALLDPAFQDAATGEPYGINYGTYCGEIPSLSGTNIPKTPFATGEDRDVTRLGLTLNWNTDFGTITSLSGYSYTELHAANDFNRDFGISMPFYYCTGTNGITNPDNGDPFCQFQQLQYFTAGVVTYEFAETDEVSEELRFTSQLDQPTRYSAAVYFYSNEVTDGDEYNNLTNYTLPNEIFNLCPCQGGLFGPNGPLLAPFGNAVFEESLQGVQPEEAKAKTESDAWAVFGWLEQDFLEGFTARAELRYTDERRKYRLFNVNNLYDPTAVALTTASDSDSWDAVTGRIGLKYQMSDNWMTYGYIANATKSGGFDFDDATLIDPGTGNRIAGVPVVATFDPEKNITYEIGAKGTNESGNFGIDIALFYIDWRDVTLPQVYTSAQAADGIWINLPPDLEGALISGGAVSIIQNVGDASVTGFELASDFQISEDWFGRVTLAYQDANWDKGTVGSFKYWPDFAPEGDISGNQVLRQAPWQASGTLNYSHQISDTLTFYGRADVSWLDEWYVGNDNLSTVPSHTYLNLRLGIESGRYRAELWGDNILDNSNPTGAFRDIYWTNTDGRNAAGQGDLRNPGTPLASDFAAFPTLRMTVNQPRLATYGLQLTARFGGPDE